MFTSCDPVQAVAAVVTQIAQDAAAKRNILGGRLNTRIVFPVKRADIPKKFITRRLTRAPFQPGKIRLPGLGSENVVASRVRVRVAAVQKNGVRELTDALKQFTTVRAVGNFVQVDGSGH